MWAQCSYTFSTASTMPLGKLASTGMLRSHQTEFFFLLD